MVADPLPPSPCDGKIINPFTDICWDCEFPITFGATDDHGPNLAPPDTENPSEATCACGDPPNVRVGLSLGYWEPMELVDVTRSPGCMVSFGGHQSLDTSGQGGAIDAHSTIQNSSFFQVHSYNFPAIRYVMGGILKDFNDASPECSQGGIMAQPNYVSEIDPAWNDSKLAAIWFPEAYLLANAEAQAACVEDAVAADAGLPQDLTYWCAGSQGIMYPFTGNVTEHISGVQGSVLIAERVTMYLHRWPAYRSFCMIKDTSPNDLCAESCNFKMPKSRYRYQMLYPVATTKEHGCLPFGRSTMLWEPTYKELFPPIAEPDKIKKKAESNTENYAYLIWRKRNCCDY